MKITLAFLLLGLTAIFAEQSEAAASSSVEAADEDVRQGQRKLPPQQWPQPPKWQPPKQQKCDPSPYCQEYWGNGVQISNCCPKPPKGGNCYEVCEEIRGGGGKKGGFGGKKGGFYYGGGYYGGKKGGYYGFGFDEVICETVCEGGYEYDYGYIGGGGGQWNGNWNQPCRGYGCNGHGQQWNNKPSYPQNDGCYEICEEDCFRGGKGGKKGGFGPGYYNYYDGPDDWGPDDDWGYGYAYYGGGFGGKGGKKGGFGGCTERCEVICPPKPKCDPSPYCKGYNCCYEPCEIVCEFIEFRGGKKGGFGGKKGGFGKGGGSFYYDDGPDDWGYGYYSGYYGGKGGKKGGYYGGGEEICEEICGYGPIYPGPIAPPKKPNKYPNYAPPKKGVYDPYW